MLVLVSVSDEALGHSPRSPPSPTRSLSGTQSVYAALDVDAPAVPTRLEAARKSVALDPADLAPAVEPGCRNLKAEFLVLEAGTGTDNAVVEHAVVLDKQYHGSLTMVDILCLSDDAAELAFDRPCFRGKDSPLADERVEIQHVEPKSDSS